MTGAARPAGDAPVRLGPIELSRPALAVVVAVAVFVLLSVVWVVVDRSLPGGGDPGIHLNTASNAADLLKQEDLIGIIELGPVGDAFFYPPLVHIVGAIPTSFGLAVQDAGTIAMNLVFVPLLAAGVYLTGRKVYGPRAGMLAALFALGTPMVLSLFHVFVLDAPLAAMVAVTVAALLESDRFSRRRASLVAGALVGACLLVKPAAPLYLLGPVAVMLALGGWRQWRNLGLAALAALAVCAPYYLVHLNEVLDVGQENTVGSEIGATGPAFDRDARISYDNLSWYAWSAVNEVYFVPLLALFAVGLVSALRDLRTRPGLAELVGGLVLTYGALALVLSIRDARYGLPLVVFVAVIATGWIATSGHRWLRRGGVAVLAVTVALNVGSSMLRGLPEVRWQIPGSVFELDNDPGTFTVFDDRGYFVGAPDPNDLWDRLFEAAEREGLGTARLNIRSTGLWSEDPVVFDVLSRRYDLREWTLVGRPGDPDLLIDTWFDDEVYIDRKGFPEPCGRIDEGIDYRAEPMLKSVLVRRHVGGGRYERWCEF